MPFDYYPLVGPSSQADKAAVDAPHRMPKVQIVINRYDAVLLRQLQHLTASAASHPPPPDADASKPASTVSDATQMDVDGVPPPGVSPSTETDPLVGTSPLLAANQRAMSDVVTNHESVAISSAIGAAWPGLPLGSGIRAYPRAHIDSGADVAAALAAVEAEAAAARKAAQAAKAQSLKRKAPTPINIDFLGGEQLTALSAKMSTAAVAVTEGGVTGPAVEIPTPASETIPASVAEAAVVSANGTAGGTTPGVLHAAAAPTPRSGSAARTPGSAGGTLVSPKIRGPYTKRGGASGVGRGGRGGGRVSPRGSADGGDGTGPVKKRSLSSLTTATGSPRVPVGTPGSTTGASQQGGQQGLVRSSSLPLLYPSLK